MTKPFIIALAALLVAAGLPLVSLAQAPAELEYQGRLADAAGAPITGTRGMTFRLYNLETGGVALWTEIHASVQVTSGTFSVVLGRTESLSTLGFDEPYFLGVTVGTDSEMIPRLRLTAAPYSLAALWGTTGPPGPEGPTSLVANDLRISGSLGVGADAGQIATLDPLTWLSGFGFATIVLADPTPRITFDDTSSTGSFPSRDWQLRANDAATGGREYFAIVDLGSSTTPDTVEGTRVFTIEAGAPEGSLYVDAGGRVGVGTGSPSADLHLRRTGGADATLRVETGVAPTSTVAELAASPGVARVGSVTAHPLQVQAGGVVQMTLNTNGTLAMADGGRYDGTWDAASSRALKTGIEPLTESEASRIVADLTPVSFRYRTRPDDVRLGFIAEDVPDAVAAPGRRNLRTTDIVAALTRVVQTQGDDIARNDATLKTLEGRLAALEASRDAGAR